MFSRRASAAFSVIVLVCSGCHSKGAHSYKDDPKLTPLMNAARYNDLPRVRTLLAGGADVKARTVQGETALYEAIYRADQSSDNLPVVDALLNAGADPNEKEFTSLLALSLDTYGNPSVTLRLLQRGARVPQECSPRMRMIRWFHSRRNRAAST
jgi:ankyrin repeat protein